MLKYQARRLGLLISNDVEQLDNIRPAAEVLQNLNLSLNLRQREGKKHIRDESEMQLHPEHKPSSS